MRLRDFDAGEEAVLHYELPTFGEAGPELYRQPELFPNRLPAPEWTAFDALAWVLEHANAGIADSARYDRALLHSLGAFRSVLNTELTEVSFVDRRPNVAALAVLNRATTETARRLSYETPASRSVRVAGRLDMLRVSTQSFALELDDGGEVGGVLADGDVGTLSELLNCRVLVHGKAVYRPSGALLRLDADLVVDGANEASIWSRVPAPLDRGGSANRYRKLQTSSTGVNAFFGSWPGDETDEELLAALHDMS
jgi:hypothetical protein